jgi:predicted metal-dependent peptidase
MSLISDDKDHVYTADEVKAIIVESDFEFEKACVRLHQDKHSIFLHHLLMKLKMKWDTRFPTACIISGKELEINPIFWMSLLDTTSRLTVLIHELWHVGFCHQIRGEGLEPRRHNNACDHIINLMLEKQGKYIKTADGEHFPWLCDSQYDDYSSEQVYAALPKDEEKDGNGGGGNNPGGAPYNNMTDIMKDGNGIGNMTGPMNTAEVQKAVENVQAANMAQEMSEGSDGIGALPGEVLLFIDDYLKPAIDWREELKDFMFGVGDPYRSYARPNRRSRGGVILPVRKPVPTIDHICYYLDVSGSISRKEQTIFNTEVRQVKEILKPAKMTICMFDTKIRSEIVLERSDHFEDLELVGGGGTDLVDVFKHIDEQAPTGAIVFSDLYVGIPKEEPDCPLLWVTTTAIGESHYMEEPAYGTTIFVDPDTIEVDD